MLAERDRLVAERFKRLMVDRGVPLHETVLFGSCARGEGDWDSDYDFLVVVEHQEGMVRETISRCAWEAGFDDCLVIVPVVVTRDEIENTPFRSSLLMQAVRVEGIPI